MNKFDTIRTKFDSSAVMALGDKYFGFTQGGSSLDKVNYHIKHIKKEVRKELPVGFISCSVDSMNGVAKLEISSKRLESRYDELIHKNNIEYLIHQINNTGIIELDQNIFLDTAECLRIDPSQNLGGFENTANCINAISVLSSKNPNFRIDPYEHAGLVFRPKQTSFKTHYRIYPKYEEMIKRKNRDIREFIDPLIFANVLRPEMQIDSFADMRKVIGIKDTRPIKLTEFLECQNNILYDGFSNVVHWDFKKERNKLKDDDMKFAESALSDKKLKFNKKMDLLSGYMLIQYFNGDMIKVNAFLSNEIRGNISSYKRKFKAIAEMIPTEREIEQVNHFMDQLKNAA